MTKTIRIGTRDSELALWQAHTVQHQLQQLGYSTEIVAVKSTGDIILDKPLYELGITGIFTKTLDVAMLSGKIDIAGTNGASRRIGATQIILATGARARDLPGLAHLIQQHHGFQRSGSVVVFPDMVV